MHARSDRTSNGKWVEMVVNLGLLRKEPIVVVVSLPQTSAFYGQSTPEEASALALELTGKFRPEATLQQRLGALKGWASRAKQKKEPEGSTCRRLCAENLLSKSVCCDQHTPASANTTAA